MVNANEGAIRMRSEYVLVVENLAPVTRAADVRAEMDYFGPIRRCERDRGLRIAIVDFDRADDARAAWNKMDGFRMDGRRWQVNWADERDFQHFEWKWFEGPPSRGSPPRSQSRTPSRSRSRSPTTHKY